MDQELPSVSHLPWLSHPSSQLLGLEPGLSGEGLGWCLSGSYHGWLLSSPMQVSSIPGANRDTRTTFWPGSGRDLAASCHVNGECP